MKIKANRNRRMPNGTLIFVAFVLLLVKFVCA